MLRPPTVAGTFYESDPVALDRQVNSFLRLDDESEGQAVGIIAPHAGYSFCGKVSGSVYSSIVIPDRVLIVGPNHTGLGSPASLADFSGWETPLGTIPQDREMSLALADACDELEIDNIAHLEEHSIEAQLPFLKMRNPQIRISAICLRTMSYDACEKIAAAIAKAIVGSNEKILIVASSDMNHHEPARVAIRKDRMALERIEILDAKGLYNGVVEHHVSMCGFVPAVILLEAARRMGARSAEIVSYANSGEINGDSSSVVGYAGVVVGRTPRKNQRPSLS